MWTSSLPLTVASLLPRSRGAPRTGVVLEPPGTRPGMTEPIRETARGRDEATPARALAGVTLFVGVVALILIAALLILWYALK